MPAVRPPTIAAFSDLLRLAWESGVRHTLPPENPEILRAVASATWRLGGLMRPARHAVMVGEVRRCFGVNLRTAEAIAREAQDSGTQARLELLLAPGIDDFCPWIEIGGDLPPGSLLLHPSMAAVPLFHAALAQRWPGIVIFRARGLPEGGRGVGPLRDGWINRRAARLRQEEEERLPVIWEQNPDALPAHLAQGARVVAAFDDRAFKSYVRNEFLGRTALLSRDPWRLAAPLYLAGIARERDRTCTALIQAAPDPSMEAGTAWFSAWLRRHPGQYALWLAECRIRAGMDDHPLFVDYHL